MNHPIQHWLIYGDSGAGKSTGATTFPKPALVLFFDPLGKDTPYRRRGVVNEVKAPDGTLIHEVLSRKDGSLLFQIEHYLEADPQRPVMWPRFLQRMTRLEADIEANGFQTVILDSVTFMELTARKYSQYVLNPTSKEPRQWFGFSTDALEELLMIRFGSLNTNVVALAHIDDQKVSSQGINVFSIAAPGRISRRGPGAYSEVYRAYATIADASGNTEYLWQTHANMMYTASTQIGAPDGSPSEYAALWTA